MALLRAFICSLRTRFAWRLKARADEMIEARALGERRPLPGTRGLKRSRECVERGPQLVTSEGSAQWLSQRRARPPKRLAERERPHQAMCARISILAKRRWGGGGERDDRLPHAGARPPWHSCRHGMRHACVAMGPRALSAPLLKHVLDERLAGLVRGPHQGPARAV